MKRWHAATTAPHHRQWGCGALRGPAAPMPIGALAPVTVAPKPNPTPHPQGEPLGNVAPKHHYLLCEPLKPSVSLKLGLEPAATQTSRSVR